MDILSVDQVLGQGRYRILPSATLGNESGTYQAYDTVSSMNVVLIDLRAVTDGASNIGSAEEIRALMQNSHRSLVNVVGFFFELERHFLVVEAVEGKSIAELFSSDITPPLSDLVKWARDLLEAVDYLHTLQPPVLHRGVGPENVWLTPSSRIKLKIPRIQRERRASVNFSDIKKSSPLSFRSLEQLWKNLDFASKRAIGNSVDAEAEELLHTEPDERSDIYGLAATLYYGMTKVVPPDALTRTISILDGGPDPLKSVCELNSNVAETISDVIMKGLRIRRENRYSSVAEMLTDFREATHALYDELTDLPTRAQFTYHLRTAIDRAEANSFWRFSVILLGLEGHASITERLGRIAGEQGLKIISERLKSCVRPSDVIARVSADQFCILLNGTGNANDIMGVAERIQSKLSEPFKFEDSEFFIAVSSGIVVSGGAEREPEDFLLEADSAISAARMSGETRCAIYVPQSMIEI